MSSVLQTDLFRQGVIIMTVIKNSHPDRRIRDKSINRFELIDETGRVIVKYGVSVELLYQDDGRTLKVVLRDNES